MANAGYQLGQVETALAAAFDVDADNLKALRGRLQHLRTNGVPDLAPVGRGGISHYSDRDVAELVLAIEWAAIGVAPSRIPAIIEASRQHFGAELGLMMAWKSKGSDWWFVIAPDFLTGEWHDSSFSVEFDMKGNPVLDGVISNMRSKYGCVAAANISARLRATFKAIAETKPAKRGP